MTRKECLDKAAECVLQGRDVTYGGPEDSFGVIANFWSVYLGRKVKLMKLAGPGLVNIWRKDSSIVVLPYLSFKIPNTQPCKAANAALHGR